MAMPAGSARADWSGDAHADVLAVGPGEQLLLYRGNGAGGWATGSAEPIGTGWGAFDAMLSPGDFSGDDRPDLLVRRTDGALLMYRGNGAGGFVTGMGEPVGSGWGPFTALLAPGDFSGDGEPDVLARHPDGGLLLYRGNGAGGWVTGAGERIGSGWQGFTSVLAGGDFSGDGKPDVLARQPDGALLLYRGNGAGGWVTGAGEQIGSGWGPLGLVTLAAQWRPPPPPPTPPSAPVPDGRVRLSAGIGCTPPGGRLRVSLRVRRRPGRPAPRVRKVVFFTRGGARKTDRRRPYVVRLPVNRPAGATGRVYARVTYRREGSRRLRHKTVSRRFVMCR
jgi:FG-GAP-like repeat